MRLRPHHALCIRKFTGHGYDQRFTEHMTKICETLRRHPETEVTITRGCDDLCAFCPNCSGGSCSTLEKVAAMDEGVRRAVDVAYGETIPWSELSKRARENVFDTANFENICQSCEWYALCLSKPLN